VRWSLENSQRPRNPLTSFGGIVVKHESGDKKISQGIGEEIQTHSSLFWPRTPFSGVGRIVVNPGSECSRFEPSDPLAGFGGIAANLVV